MSSRIVSDLREIMEENFSHYHPADTLSLHSFESQHTIEYIPQALSNDWQDRSVLRMICYPTSRLAWLSYLNVASEYRRCGRGASLAKLAERIAGHFSCPIIHIRPLYRAIGFWESVGYRPEPGTAQVLSKACDGFVVVRS